MRAGRWITAAAVIVLIGALAWLLFVVIPARYGAGQPTGSGATPAVPAPATPRIKATLFFVAEDGQSLVEVEREVAFGGGPMEQGRELLAAEFGAAPPPLVSPVPEGTGLRAFFVTSRGRAYVDLSREAARAQPGGSLSEQLTVSAIVGVLTANLPAITEVQILVDGREVESLAGHLDLRRPWTRATIRQSARVSEPGSPGTTAPPFRD